jgi:DNA-binding transcriptional LysR family regulator
VRSGSLAQAALELGVSIATVSERLAALARSGGQPLFQRTGRHLRPTRNARALLPVVRQVARLVRDAQELMHTGPDGGLLTLAVNPVYGSSYLAPVVLGLKLRYPTVRFAIRVRQSTEVLAMLLEQRCEFGIVSRRIDLPEFVQVPMLTDEVILVASPNTAIGKRRAMEASGRNALCLISSPERGG